MAVIKRETSLSEAHRQLLSEWSRRGLSHAEVSRNGLTTIIKEIPISVVCRSAKGPLDCLSMNAAKSLSPKRPAPFVNWLAVIATLASIQVPRLAGEASFEPLYVAEGNLVQQIVTNSVVRQTQVWYFRIAEDEAGKWQLEVNTKVPDPHFPVRSTESLTYDGTNIYSILDSPDLVVFEGGRPKIVDAMTNAHAARICAGAYPIDHSSAIGALWLTFLGGRYLSDGGKTVRFPNLIVSNARQDPVAWGCDFEYSLNRYGFHSLIQSGRFLLNTNHVKLDSLAYWELDEPHTPKEFEVLRARLRLLATLDQSNQVRTLYQLDKSTQFAGRLVPVEFHYVISRDPAIRLLGLQVLQRGVVTNILRGSRVPLLPKPDGVVTVQDRRLRQKDVLRWRQDVLYVLDQRGWLLDTNDTVIRAALLRKQPALRITGARSRTGYIGACVFLVALILAPLLWAGRSIVRHRGRISQ